MAANLALNHPISISTDAARAFIAPARLAVLVPLAGSTRSAAPRPASCPEPLRMGLRRSSSPRDRRGVRAYGAPCTRHAVGVGDPRRPGAHRAASQHRAAFDRQRRMLTMEQRLRRWAGRPDRLRSGDRGSARSSPDDPAELLSSSPARFADLEQARLPGDRRAGPARSSRRAGLSPERRRRASRRIGAADQAEPSHLSTSECCFSASVEFDRADGARAEGIFSTSYAASSPGRFATPANRPQLLLDGCASLDEARFLLGEMAPACSCWPDYFPAGTPRIRTTSSTIGYRIDAVCATVREDRLIAGSTNIEQLDPGR